MKTIEVVAAVIKNKDLFLATQRGYGEFRGMWEFPGGKIEPLEDKKEALVREIKEELNANISVDKYLCTVEYNYPEFHLIMYTYICSLKSKTIENMKHNDKELEHEDFKWLSINNIDDVKWLPADIEIVNILKKYQH